MKHLNLNCGCKYLQGCELPTLSSVIGHCVLASGTVDSPALSVVNLAQTPTTVCFVSHDQLKPHTVVLTTQIKMPFPVCICGTVDGDTTTDTFLADINFAVQCLQEPVWPKVSGPLEVHFLQASVEPPVRE